MTPANELAQMAEVVTAKYEQEQREFAKLVARENQLRAELMRLDDMRRDTSVPDASVAQMQAIGADVKCHTAIS
jgi:cell division protein FtsB